MGQINLHKRNFPAYKEKTAQILEAFKQIQCSSYGKESACNAGHLGLILDREDPLEKEMPTHSGILAWRIPWTEEPGGLQSMGL